MLRRRNIKLLIAIPVVWILVMFLVGLNNDNSSPSVDINSKNEQILIDKEKIKSLVKQNEELADIARINKEQVDRILDENKLEKVKIIDHDHPEEERIKAEEQAKKGQVQVVHAPKDNNPNAPGKFYYLLGGGGLGR